MKIVLSIVIPTHNSQTTIPHLLDSINSSNFRHFKNIEAVIVDDCSKDGTVKIIKQMQNSLRFPIRLVRQRRNLGPAKTRNCGVTKTKGKFILFLDSDVILFPNTLKKAYELMEKGHKAFTGIWHYRQSSRAFFPQFKALRDWTYWFIEREKNFRYYLFSTRIAGIEKKLFDKIGGFNTAYPEATVEDIELTYRIAKQTKIKFCPQLIVRHEFEDFFTIVKKYFKRSRDWSQLYEERLRFDPVATSRREAAKSIIVALIIVFGALAVFEHVFLYTILVLFFGFCYLEFRFWRFLFQKKGPIFLFQAIPVSIALYTIINLGAFWGFIHYFRKFKGLRRVPPDRISKWQ